VKDSVDLLALEALADHTQIVAADERLTVLGQQRADAEADSLALQEKRARYEAEAARQLEVGATIAPDIQERLDAVDAELGRQDQVCRVLDAAIEHETAARDALLRELLREVLAELKEQHRNAIVDLHWALAAAAEANEHVMSVQDAASRLGRQVFGGGTANSAGIGTGASAAVVTADPLPDLAWRELSLRTTRIQPETRLRVWRDYASRVLGIKLNGGVGR